MNQKEALKIVWELFSEGDDRYSDSISERVLANLIINHAVLIEEKEIPEILSPTEQDLWKFKGLPQQEYKYLGEVLLKREGFQDKEIFWEIKYLSSRPDVFAISEIKRVIVECCSCRISKVISYLSDDNTELWLLTRGNLPWHKTDKFEKSKWFIVTRGENWDKFNKEIDESFFTRIKKLPDLLKGLA